jgi:hypothetical protein
MKMLKIIIFILITLHAVEFPGAENAIFKASARAGILTLVEGGGEQPGKYHLFFRLYITNIEKNKMLIPTAGFYKNGDYGRDYYTSILRWDFHRTREGSMIIPPASSLGIVELLPGESALISWEDDISWKSRLEKVSVKLEIDAGFRSRFNLALIDLMVKNIKTGFIKNVDIVIDDISQGMNKEGASLGTNGRQGNPK